MPLNSEERYRQQMYKVQQQENEADIAELEEELRLCKQTNDRINDELDQLILQRDLVDKECKKFQFDRQDEEEFTKRILQIMGWRL